MARSRLQAQSLRPLLRSAQQPHSTLPAAWQHFSASTSSKNNDSGGKPKGVNGKQPKILSESPPEPGKEPEDVRKHNEEMEQRADRAAARVSNKDAENDKVPPGYWSGQSQKQ